MALLIDRILRDGKPGEDVLLAKLGRGLSELRLAHKDVEVRAEIHNVLRYCFDQAGDTWTTRALPSDQRLKKRVDFLLAEGPRMDPGLHESRQQFALRLVDDIKANFGEDSPLLLKMMVGMSFPNTPDLEQLKDAVYERQTF